MKLDFDPAKSDRNIAERGLSFQRVEAFEFAAALIAEDVRKPYPERRFQALGHVDGRLHMLVFTPMVDGIRVISFRKANSREVKRYEKATQS